MVEGIFCGRGGQGVLTVARLFGLAAARAGHAVRSEERRGVAVRGGSVSSLVRVGPFASAYIPEGSARFVVALHPAEGLRYLPLLGEGGLFLSDGAPAWGEPPAGVRPVLVDASALARERLGRTVFAGQLLLGRLFAELPDLFPPGGVRESLRGAPRLAPRALELGAETLPRPGSPGGAP